jgi:hypothetical protein
MIPKTPTKQEAELVGQVRSTTGGERHGPEGNEVAMGKQAAGHGGGLAFEG